MTGMACRLFDEVEKDPTNRATFGIGKPGLDGERHPALQVIDFNYRCIGSSTHLFVLPDGTSKRLVF
jgi:hypothetical protein